MEGFGRAAAPAGQSAIADAPYRATALILNPGEGAGAGLIGAALMLLVVAAAHPHVAATPSGVLRRVGTMVLGPVALRSGAGVVAGAVIHGGLGAALGLLYAMCQERAPAGGLVLVGIFYGVVLWVGGGILSNLPFWAAVRTLVHTRVWLLACCIYGMVLATAAAAGVRRWSPERTSAGSED